jgi:hypothetical protein
VADPRHARVAFRIESDLLATGRAAVAVRFPYASDGFFATSDRDAPDRHTTTLHLLDQHACRFGRILDDTSYAMRPDWSEGGIGPAAQPHTFELTSPAATLDLEAGFAPGGVLGRGEFTTIEGAAISWWREFWTSGAAVDFAGSPDPRAAELERRRPGRGDGDHWDWNSAWGWDFPVMAMTATRLGRPDLAVDALLGDSAKNTYLPTGHSPQIGSLLPTYLPANGALLAAVSLMAADGEGADRDCPGFPRDGRWTVRHEGFTPWPRGRDTAHPEQDRK